MKNMRQISNELDKLAKNYRIGKLQEIRKEIKQLVNRPGSNIFSDQTTSENYAFHRGGRSEIQFNIGFEEDGFRYGLAFSLETSKSLPNINILFPKILMFNCLVKEYPNYFSNYLMWFFQNGYRSENSSVFEIPSNLINEGTFIFIGKLMSYDQLNYDQQAYNYILTTFDELLDIYIKVESQYSKQPSFSRFAENNTPDILNFVKKATKLPTSRGYNITAQHIEIEVHHSFLQKKLQLYLEGIYGTENVCLEHDCFGKSIDLVVRDNQGELLFYEVKTASSARSCIRQAIGQLFEYAYGNGIKYAKTIIVAGEPPLDNGCRIYLDFLRQEFGLPIDYLQIQ